MNINRMYEATPWGSIMASYIVYQSHPIFTLARDWCHCNFACSIPTLQTLQHSALQHSYIAYTTLSMPMPTLRTLSLVWAWWYIVPS